MLTPNMERKQVTRIYTPKVEKKQVFTPKIERREVVISTTGGNYLLPVNGNQHPPTPELKKKSYLSIFKKEEKDLSQSVEDVLCDDSRSEDWSSPYRSGSL